MKAVTSATGPWANVRVLVTGHTGFKGAWLSLWLEQVGAEVFGISLPAQPGSLYERAGLQGRWREALVDIRDREALTAAVRSFEPAIVFHLAAQPLVGVGYEDPVGTFETNVMGTVNLVDVVRRVPATKGCVLVTTDKVYRNDESGRALKEGDPLGGSDPYSASKSSAEHVAVAWSNLWEAGSGPRIVTARAGNVVGGGDFAERRLLPDLVRAFASRTPARVRNPSSTRPWQHVLDPLHGYLLLGERILRDESAPEAVNLGPLHEHPVSVVADLAVELWGEGASWTRDTDDGPPESRLLALDSGLARRALRWRPTWDMGKSVGRTLNWWKEVLRGQPAEEMCLIDIATFEQERFQAEGPAS